MGRLVEPDEVFSSNFIAVCMGYLQFRRCCESHGNAGSDAIHLSNSEDIVMCKIVFVIISVMASKEIYR